MSTPITMRPVRGVEDIEYNFTLLLGAVTSFDGTFIQPGTLTAAALREQFPATPTQAGMVRQAAAVADLGQTISDPPTQAEVQAISAKMDAVLAALRAAGVLAGA